MKLTRALWLTALLGLVAILGLAAAGNAHASMSLSFSDEGNFKYGYIEPGEDGNQVISGDYPQSLKDIARDAKEPLLWFERDGADYVVRGSAYTSRARTALQPVMDLGHQQGQLGAKQGKLGAEQGALGARMGEIGARLAALSTRQALGGLDGRDADDIADERKALQHEMSQLQHEMGARQRELGERQRELGTKQRELGERQRAASRKAEAELRHILDDAVRAGQATRLAQAHSTFWTI
jgi:bla regulator protein blaR1